MNKIKEIRKKQNITQERLAELSGVSRQTIASIENGKYEVITNITMKKIADALNKSVGYIFFNWLAQYVKQRRWRFGRSKVLYN